MTTARRVGTTTIKPRSCKNAPQKATRFFPWEWEGGLLGRDGLHDRSTLRPHDGIHRLRRERLLLLLLTSSVRGGVWRCSYRTASTCAIWGCICPSRSYCGEEKSARAHR